MTNTSTKLLLAGGLLLFTTFIFMGIIANEVMGVITKHNVDENTPNAQEFIHEQLPELSTHQLIGSVTFHAGVVVLIIAGFVWRKERKKLRNPV